MFASAGKPPAVGPRTLSRRCSGSIWDVGDDRPVPAWPWRSCPAFVRARIIRGIRVGATIASTTRPALLLQRRLMQRQSATTRHSGQTATPAGEHREAHVPAQQPPPFEEARLPAAHVRPRRPQRHPLPSAQGSAQAQRLIDSITYRWEFQLLRDAGRYRRSGPLGLRQATHDDPHSPAHVDRPRVAFAIGRSVGSAVVRNRVRRQLREILRTADRSGHLRPGRYLFVVSPDVPSLSFGELQAHVDRLIGPTSAVSGS
jgi:ribonuclease P protein component